MGKSAWVLTMAYISCNDLPCDRGPCVWVEAIGTRRDCLRVLRESVKKTVANHWLGVAEREEKAKEIMASETNYYGTGIKGWTVSWEDSSIEWRLQRKKVELAEREVE